MRTVFAGGRVFDGTGAPLADADVAVEAGRIVDVGPGLDGDDVVDVSGRSLLPGLFDTHVHVMLSHVNLWRLLQTPFSQRFFEAARNLEATVQIGVTTVRDAGGADLGVKRAVEEGLVRGPRVQISIRMISQTGGHGDAWMPSGARLELFPRYPGCPDAIVDGPHEMRRKVRELVRDGAEVIKVATSGGVLSPADKPQNPSFDMEELEVLVAEARAAGLSVMAHAQATEGIKNAVRAGIRSIEHGIYLDDEAIELMLDRGTYLVPTLMAPIGVLEAAEAGAMVTDAALAKAREVVDVHRESVRRAVAAGVRVAMGTDSGVTPHGDNLRELELMEQCGMGAEDVLVATTSVAAELMGLERELGTLEPGKRADVVVVDGDPFDFATLRQRVVAVYQDGVRVAGAEEVEPALAQRSA
ncbi:MAG: amidohydrolase family protein [Actinomycetota bacterium]|nr:amidohydrolase family protein [Actinomycetota bacterium]